MATSSEKFSKGYEGKKKAKVRPKKVEVAGPYRSESSVKSIREEATPHEHRKVRVRSKKPDVPTPAEVDLDVPELGSRRQRARTRKARHDRAKIESTLRIPSAKQVRVRPARTQTASERDPSNTPGYAPTKAEALAKPVLDTLEQFHREGKIGKSLGQKIYDKIAEYGPAAITLGPELKAGMEGLNLALRGTEVGGARIGGSAASRVLKPVESEARNASQIASATSRADAQLAKTGSRLGRAASPDKALARELTGTKTAAQIRAQAGLPGAVAKGVGAQAAAVVRGHEQAVIENPGKVAKTTARALPGFVTVPVGMAVNAALTPGRAASTGLHAAGVPGFKGYSGEEILAPIKYEGKSQIDFAKQVAGVLTSGDPDYVQKAVEDELGLLLPITAGLGIKAGLDHMGRGDGSAAEAIVGRVRETVEHQRRRLGGRFGINEHREGAAVFEKHAQRKKGARLVDEAKRGADIEELDRTKQLSKAAGGRGDRALHPTGRNNVNGEPVNVTEVDAARYLLAHRIDFNAPHDQIMRELKRLRERLRETREELDLPRDRSGEEKADYLDTEDVLDALIANPDWTKKDGRLHKVVEEAAAQEATNRANPKNFDHSEAARFEPSAIDLGIPTRHERIPFAERDRLGGARTWTEAMATLYDDIEGHKRRRDQARAETRIARSGWNADKNPATRERLDQALDRERQVNRIGDELAARSREIRQGIEKGNRIADPELDREMIEETRASLEAHPARGIPEFTSEVHAPVDRPEQMVSGANMPGGIKHRSGRAARTGSVEEGLHPYVQNSITRPTRRRHTFQGIKAGLDAVQFRKGDQHKFTMREWEALKAEKGSGVNEENFMLVPDQLVKRIDDEASRAERRDAENYVPPEKLLSELLDTISDDFMEGERARPSRGRTYRIVPKSWGEEVFKSFTGPGAPGKLGQRLNKWSNYLILQTSPAWALTQFGAEYAQASLATPKLINPFYARKLIKAYHAMDPVIRREFETWVGATTRDLREYEKPALTMKGADDAYRVLDRTQLGRFLRGVPIALRTVDQWKGSRIRVLSAMAKMDRDFNGRLNSFLHASGKMYRLQRQYSRELRGKSPTEIAEYVTTHGDLQDRYRTYLDDMMGNWTALSKREQAAAQFVIFYPFLRMSLRWTFNAFPKNHPIRAAASYWLGQQNANELHELLNGDPSFFGYWGNVPLHTGPGAATLELPLSRLGVSGNALIEALGGSLESSEGPAPAAIGLSIAQPAITAGVRATTGISKFTGKQEPHSLGGAASELFGLSTLTRQGARVEEALTGTTPKEGAPPILVNRERQSALDKLFEKLRGDTVTSTIRGVAMPAVPFPIELTRDKGHLTAVLKTLSETGTIPHKEKEQQFIDEGRAKEWKAEEERMWKRYDHANKALDRLFRKYGLAAEQKAEDEAYEQAKEEARSGGSLSPLQKAEHILDGGANPRLKKAEEALEGGNNAKLKKAEEALGL